MAICRLYVPFCIPFFIYSTMHRCYVTYMHENINMDIYPGVWLIKQSHHSWFGKLITILDGLPNATFSLFVALNIGWKNFFSWQVKCYQTVFDWSWPGNSWNQDSLWTIKAVDLRLCSHVKYPYSFQMHPKVLKYSTKYKTYSHLRVADHYISTIWYKVTHWALYTTKTENLIFFLDPAVFFHQILGIWLQMRCTFIPAN